MTFYDFDAEKTINCIIKIPTLNMNSLFTGGVKIHKLNTHLIAIESKGQFAPILLLLFIINVVPSLREMLQILMQLETQFPARSPKYLVSKCVVSVNSS